MKTIKFRGETIGGSFNYGDLYHCGGLTGIWCKKYGVFNPYEVKPETVALFVGYDKNGKEIYSNDKIRVYDHFSEIGVEINVLDAADFFKISDIGKTFDNVELVEEVTGNENL